MSSSHSNETSSLTASRSNITFSSFNLTDDPPYYKGWLNKRGKVNAMWKRRYCILKQGFLSYYEYSTSAKPKGSIPLFGATIQEGDGNAPAITAASGIPGITSFTATVGEGFSSSTAKTAAERFVFTIAPRDSSRVYVFHAEFEEEMIEWIQVLRAAVAHAQVSAYIDKLHGTANDLIYMDPKKAQKTAKERAKEAERQNKEALKLQKKAREVLDKKKKSGVKVDESEYERVENLDNFRQVNQNIDTSVPEISSLDIKYINDAMAYTEKLRNGFTNFDAFEERHEDEFGNLTTVTGKNARTVTASSKTSRKKSKPVVPLLRDSVVAAALWESSLGSDIPWFYRDRPYDITKMYKKYVQKKEQEKEKMTAREEGDDGTNISTGVDIGINAQQPELTVVGAVTSDGLSGWSDLLLSSSDEEEQNQDDIYDYTTTEGDPGGSIRGSGGVNTRRGVSGKNKTKAYFSNLAVDCEGATISPHPANATNAVNSSGFTSKTTPNDMVGGLFSIQKASTTRSQPLPKAVESEIAGGTSLGTVHPSLGLGTDIQVHPQTTTDSSSSSIKSTVTSSSSSSTSNPQRSNVRVTVETNEHLTRTLGQPEEGIYSAELAPSLANEWRSGAGIGNTHSQWRSSSLDGGDNAHLLDAQLIRSGNSTLAGASTLHRSSVWDEKRLKDQGKALRSMEGNDGVVSGIDITRDSIFNLVGVPQFAQFAQFPPYIRAYEAITGITAPKTQSFFTQNQNSSYSSPRDSSRQSHSSFSTSSSSIAGGAIGGGPNTPISTLSSSLSTSNGMNMHDQGGSIDILAPTPFPDYADVVVVGGSESTNGGVNFTGLRGGLLPSHLQHILAPDVPGEIRKYSKLGLSGSKVSKYDSRRYKGKGTGRDGSTVRYDRGGGNTLRSSRLTHTVHSSDDDDIDDDDNDYGDRRHGRDSYDESDEYDDDFYANEIEPLALRLPAGLRLEASPGSSRSFLSFGLNVDDNGNFPQEDEDELSRVFELEQEKEREKEEEHERGNRGLSLSLSLTDRNDRNRRKDRERDRDREDEYARLKQQKFQKLVAINVLHSLYRPIPSLQNGRIAVPCPNGIDVNTVFENGIGSAYSNFRIQNRQNKRKKGIKGGVRSRPSGGKCDTTGQNKSLGSNSSLSPTSSFQDENWSDNVNHQNHINSPLFAGPAGQGFVSLYDPSIIPTTAVAASAPIRAPLGRITYNINSSIKRTGGSSGSSGSGSGSNNNAYSSSSYSSYTPSRQNLASPPTSTTLSVPPDGSAVTAVSYIGDCFVAATNNRLVHVYYAPPSSLLPSIDHLTVHSNIPESRLYDTSGKTKNNSGSGPGSGSSTNNSNNASNINDLDNASNSIFSRNLNGYSTIALPEHSDESDNEYDNHFSKNFKQAIRRGGQGGRDYRGGRGNRGNRGNYNHTTSNNNSQFSHQQDLYNEGIFPGSKPDQFPGFHLTSFYVPRNSTEESIISLDKEITGSTITFVESLGMSSQQRQIYDDESRRRRAQSQQSQSQSRPLDSLSQSASALSPSLFVVTGSSNSIALWDIQKTSECIGSLSSGTTMTAFATHTANSHLSGTGDQILSTGNSRGVVRLLDLHNIGLSSAVLYESIPYSSPVRSIAWCPSVPDWCAVVHSDGTLRIWDRRISVVPTFSAKPSKMIGVTSIAWSASHAEILATGHNDGMVCFWSLRAAPHYLLARRRVCRGSITNISFGSASPCHVIVVSDIGEVVSVVGKAELLQTLLSLPSSAQSSMLTLDSLFLSQTITPNVENSFALASNAFAKTQPSTSHVIPVAIPTVVTADEVYEKDVLGIDDSGYNQRNMNYNFNQDGVFGFSNGYGAGYGGDNEYDVDDDDEINALYNADLYVPSIIRGYYNNQLFTPARARSARGGASSSKLSSRSASLSPISQSQSKDDNSRVSAGTNDNQSYQRVKGHGFNIFGHANGYYSITPSGVTGYGDTTFGMSGGASGSGSRSGSGSGTGSRSMTTSGSSSIPELYVTHSLSPRAQSQPQSQFSLKPTTLSSTQENDLYSDKFTMKKSMSNLGIFFHPSNKSNSDANAHTNPSSASTANKLKSDYSDFSKVPDVEPLLDNQRNFKSIESATNTGLGVSPTHFTSSNPLLQRIHTIEAQRYSSISSSGSGFSSGSRKPGDPYEYNRSSSVTLSRKLSMVELQRHVHKSTFYKPSNYSGVNVNVSTTSATGTNAITISSTRPSIEFGTTSDNHDPTSTSTSSTSSTSTALFQAGTIVLPRFYAAEAILLALSLQRDQQGLARATSELFNGYESVFSSGYKSYLASTRLGSQSFGHYFDSDVLQSGMRSNTNDDRNSGSSGSGSGSGGKSTNSKTNNTNNGNTSGNSSNTTTGSNTTSTTTSNTNSTSTTDNNITNTNNTSGANPTTSDDVNITSPSITMPNVTATATISRYGPEAMHLQTIISFLIRLSSGSLFQQTLDSVSYPDLFAATLRIGLANLVASAIALYGDTEQSGEHFHTFEQLRQNNANRGSSRRGSQGNMLEDTILDDWDLADEDDEDKDKVIITKPSMFQTSQSQSQTSSHSHHRISLGVRMAAHIVSIAESCFLDFRGDQIIWSNVPLCDRDWITALLIDTQAVVQQTFQQHLSRLALCIPSSSVLLSHIEPSWSSRVNSLKIRVSLSNSLRLQNWGYVLSLSSHICNSIDAFSITDTDIPMYLKYDIFALLAHKDMVLRVLESSGQGSKYDLDGESNLLMHVQTFSALHSMYMLHAVHEGGGGSGSGSGSSGNGNGSGSNSGSSSGLNSNRNNNFFNNTTSSSNNSGSSSTPFSTTNMNTNTTTTGSTSGFNTSRNVNTSGNTFLYNNPLDEYVYTYSANTGLTRSASSLAASAATGDGNDGYGMRSSSSNLDTTINSTRSTANGASYGTGTGAGAGLGEDNNHTNTNTTRKTSSGSRKYRYKISGAVLRELYQEYCDYDMYCNDMNMILNSRSGSGSGDGDGDTYVDGSNGGRITKSQRTVSSQQYKTVTGYPPNAPITFNYQSSTAIELFFIAAIHAEKILRPSFSSGSLNPASSSGMFQPSDMNMAIWNAPAELLVSARRVLTRIESAIRAMRRKYTALTAALSSSQSTVGNALAQTLFKTGKMLFTFPLAIAAAGIVGVGTVAAGVATGVASAVTGTDYGYNPNSTAVTTVSDNYTFKTLMDANNENATNGLGLGLGGIDFSSMTGDGRGGIGGSGSGSAGQFGRKNAFGFNFNFDDIAHFAGIAGLLKGNKNRNRNRKKTRLGLGLGGLTTGKNGKGGKSLMHQSIYEEDEEEDDDGADDDDDDDDDVDDDDDGDQFTTGTETETDTDVTETETETDQSEYDSYSDDDRTSQKFGQFGKNSFIGGFGKKNMKTKGSGNKDKSGRNDKNDKNSSNNNSLSDFTSSEDDTDSDTLNDPFSNPVTAPSIDNSNIISSSPSSVSVSALVRSKYNSQRPYSLRRMVSSAHLRRAIDMYVSTPYLAVTIPSVVSSSTVIASARPAPQPLTSIGIGIGSSLLTMLLISTYEDYGNYHHLSQAQHYQNVLRVKYGIQPKLTIQPQSILSSKPEKAKKMSRKELLAAANASAKSTFFAGNDLSMANISSSSGVGAGLGGGRHTSSTSATTSTTALSISHSHRRQSDRWIHGLFDSGSLCYMTGIVLRHNHIAAFAMCLRIFEILREKDLTSMFVQVAKMLISPTSFSVGASDQQSFFISEWAREGLVLVARRAPLEPMPELVSPSLWVGPGEYFHAEEEERGEQQMQILSYRRREQEERLSIWMSTGEWYKPDELTPEMIQSIPQSNVFWVGMKQTRLRSVISDHDADDLALGTGVGGIGGGISTKLGNYHDLDSVLSTSSRIPMTTPNIAPGLHSRLGSGPTSGLPPGPVPIIGYSDRTDPMSTMRSTVLGTRQVSQTSQADVGHGTGYGPMTSSSRVDRATIMSRRRLEQFFRERTKRASSFIEKDISSPKKIQETLSSLYDLYVAVALCDPVTSVAYETYVALRSHGYPSNIKSVITTMGLPQSAVRISQWCTRYPNRCAPPPSTFSSEELIWKTRFVCSNDFIPAWNPYRLVTISRLTGQPVALVARCSDSLGAPMPALNHAAVRQILIQRNLDAILQSASASGPSASIAGNKGDRNDKNDAEEYKSVTTSQRESTRDITSFKLPALHLKVILQALVAAERLDFAIVVASGWILEICKADDPSLLAMKPEHSQRALGSFLAATALNMTLSEQIAPQLVENIQLNLNQLPKDCVNFEKSAEAVKAANAANAANSSNNSTVINNSGSNGIMGATTSDSSLMFPSTGTTNFYSTPTPLGPYKPYYIDHFIRIFDVLITLSTIVFNAQNLPTILHHNLHYFFTCLFIEFRILVYSVAQDTRRYAPNTAPIHSVAVLANRPQLSQLAIHLEQPEIRNRLITSVLLCTIILQSLSELQQTSPVANSGSANRVVVANFFAAVDQLKESLK